MKRLFCLLLAVMMLLSLCACGDKEQHNHDRDDTQRGNQVGDLAYGASLTEISENGVALTTFDPTELGKITVLNFWAYWCGPCMRELPAFSQIAEDYGDEVEVIAVHCDDLTKAQETIGENFADSAIRFAMDSDENPFAYYEKLGGPGSIPYTVVLDAEGIIRNIFTGAIEYDTLADAIEECRVEKTPILTTQHQVALKRGNQVGDVCYNAQLPIITAEGIQEETIDPTSFSKVTVLYFWGTWNGACVNQMPALDAVAREYSDDVAVVAIHQLFHTDAAAFIRDNHANSPIVFAADTGTNGNDYFKTMTNHASYPFAVILNEKGIITHTAVGGAMALETMILEAMGRM